MIRNSGETPSRDSRDSNSRNDRGSRFVTGAEFRFRFTATMVTRCASSGRVGARASRQVAKISSPAALSGSRFINTADRANSAPSTADPCRRITRGCACCRSCSRWRELSGGILQIRASRRRLSTTVLLASVIRLPVAEQRVRSACSSSPWWILLVRGVSCVVPSRITVCPSSPRDERGNTRSAKLHERPHTLALARSLLLPNREQRNGTYINNDAPIRPASSINCKFASASIRLRSSEMHLTWFVALDLLIDNYILVFPVQRTLHGFLGLSTIEYLENRKIK